MEQAENNGASPLSFRDLVRISVKVRQIGWYAARQRILKLGGTMEDVAKVLVWQLRILGAKAEGEAQRAAWLEKRLDVIAESMVFEGRKS